MHVEINQQVPDSEKVDVHSKMVDVLSRVTPSMRKDAQEEDADISKTKHYVKSSRKPILAQIRKIKSRPVQRYLRQFYGWYFAKQCCTEFMSKMRPNTINLFYQLSLGPRAMELLHNQSPGHQAMEL